MSATVAYSTTGGKRCAEARNLRDARLSVAHSILDNCGMSHSKIARLVQRFEHDVEPLGWSFFDFVANAVQMDAERRTALRSDPDLRMRIAYADPVGEQAVGFQRKRDY